jgi:hypothetical protein
LIEAGEIVGVIRFIAAVSFVLVGVGIVRSPCFAQSPPPASREPQLFGENVISTADDESHPAFTPDGKMLYFLKNDPLFIRSDE